MKQETMTAAEYQAELAKPAREKESVRIARLFLSQIRARKLPEPRSKLHPEGELRFAGDVEAVVRFKRMKTDRAPAWRFDFAWPEQRIAVEYQGVNVRRGADGKMHTSGGHADVQHLRSQHEKHAWATVLGWRVLYFERDMVQKGYAVDMLVRLFVAVELNASAWAMELLRRDVLVDGHTTMQSHIGLDPNLDAGRYDVRVDTGPLDPRSGVLVDQLKTARYCERLARGMGQVETDELNFAGQEPQR